MKTRLSLTTCVVAAVALALGAAPAKAAADIPCSTAKLIVPWKAGGGTHVSFSIFEKTIQNLDVTPKVKVVSIGGQGGNKGAKEAAKAAFLNSSKEFQGTEPLAPTMSGVEVRRETMSNPSKWKSMRPFR